METSATFTRESRTAANAIATQKTAAADALVIAETVKTKGVGAIAKRVRDTLVLDDSVIFLCVNQAIRSMEPHSAELFRRSLQSTGDFGLSIKRLTCDLGVVLSLAKTFESDEAFIDSASLLSDINFAGYDNKIAEFAKLLIDTDLKAAKAAKDGVGGPDAILYEMLPYDVIKRRLKALSAFVDHAVTAMTH